MTFVLLAPCSTSSKRKYVTQEYFNLCLTEAAFTLLLYWELLHWEERPLREFLHYPAQSEWHRKEGLCRKVIHYFNKGKVFTDAALFQQQLNRIWSNSYKIQLKIGPNTMILHRRSLEKSKRLSEKWWAAIVAKAGLVYNVFKANG